MNQNHTFVPVLNRIEKDQNEPVERKLRRAIIQALQDPEVAAAIAPFKTNGSVLGHKVLDNGAAYNELAKASPDFLQDVLCTQAVSLFRKTQILDGVLRTEYKMDNRTGKLTGEKSDSYVRRLEKKAARSQQTE
jgi:hypothetical protein